MSETVTDSPTAWVADHIRRYEDTNGADGHIWQGVPTLLLTTLGRSSGVWRRTALIYGVDGGDHVVVASQGGRPDNPSWYANLVAHREVRVQVAADRFVASARTASAAEKARLWPLMTAIWPAYDEYQAKTDRDIPIVILARHSA